jgi:hypothetical protein
MHANVEHDQGSSTPLTRQATEATLQQGRKTMQIKGKHN